MNKDFFYGWNTPPKTLSPPDDKNEGFEGVSPSTFQIVLKNTRKLLI
jgi:hypothetical protein